jgi:hypothetical protein
LNNAIDWTLSHWDYVSAVLSSSLLAVVLGFVLRTGRRIWQEIHGRGRVVLIRNSRSPLVQWIEDVQERVFPPDECDPRGLLGRRIDASKFGPFDRPHSDDALLAIVYVKGRTPVAYLSAEYYRDIGAIFFWYIVSLRDQSYKEALSDLHLDWDDIASVRESIPPKLIEKLLSVCGGKRGWKFVVAEVDAAAPSGEAIGSARKKVASFQRFAEDILRRWQRNPIGRWRLRRRRVDPRLPRVFKVDMGFMMPLHDSDLLHEAHRHESPGWLIFAPRQPRDYGRNGRYAISGAEVKDRLLRALLLRGYRDPENAEYNDYIASFYADLAGDLPETIPLIFNRNLMN